MLKMFFNHLGRHNTFIDEDVINVGWYFLLNVLVLHSDHIHDCCHDVWSHIEIKSQLGKAVSDLLDFLSLKWSKWPFNVFVSWLRAGPTPLHLTPATAIPSICAHKHLCWLYTCWHAHWAHNNPWLDKPFVCSFAGCLSRD